MNTKTRLILILSLVLLGGMALWTMWAQAAPQVAPLAGGSPTVVSYQGEVRVSGTPYAGDGFFKFAVVNSAGDTTYWSNDGSNTGPVCQGLSKTNRATVPISFPARRCERSAR